MRFDGKHVLVTGASGGIGGQTALLFAEHGASVAIHYYKGQFRAEEIRDKIVNLKKEAIIVQADLSNPDEADKLIKETVDAFGKLDVLVNNAAVHPPPMFDLNNPDWEQWKKMIDANIMGVLACSKTATP